MSSRQGPFSIASHSQDGISVLQTNSSSSKSIVDWGAAESISRLSTQIINPPPPYDPSDTTGLDPLEPLLPAHAVSFTPGIDGMVVAELHFMSVGNAGEASITINKVQQLAHALVDLKSVVAWFYPARVLVFPGQSITTTPAGTRLFETVKDIVSYVDRSGAWSSVGSISSDGGNVLMQFSAQQSMSQDSETLRAVRAALDAMKHEIDETLDGLQRLRPGLEIAQRSVNKLRGTIESCCPKIVTLAAELASATLPDGVEVYCTPQQMHFTIEWGMNIKRCWTGRNLDQLGVFDIGWTRIGAIIISTLSIGSNIRDKLNDAITAIDARLLNASAPTTDDALDQLSVVLKQFMSKLEAWVRNVDEILIINKQYLADGSRSNPLSRLFSGGFAPVVVKELLPILPNDPSVFMPSEPSNFSVPLATAGPPIQPVLPF